MYKGVVNKFNRGEVDAHALARDDFAKTNNSASYMMNWLPIRLGPMTYRPGTEVLGTVPGISYFVPFIRSMDEIAQIEFTDNLLRVWVDDSPVTRSSVTATITNGSFTSDITTGWTQADESGSTSSWDAGGYLSLLGNKTSSAVTYQTLANDFGVEHGLRIVVVEGPVRLRLGTSGGESYDIYDGILNPGTHSVAFTPSGIVTITLSNANNYRGLVDSVEIEGAGIMTLPTLVAESNLPSLRYAQSADVLFFAYDSGKMFRVERRGVRSWSVTDTRVDNGPFNAINTGSVSMQSSALSGNVTLTATADYFNNKHPGSLIKLASNEQEVEKTVTSSDDGTENVRITGAKDLARTMTIVVKFNSGASGTVKLQRSTDEATWEDVESYTANVQKTWDDNQVNVIYYYRLWVTSFGGSGNIYLRLNNTSGSIEGICRIISVLSSTSASVQVLQSFGSKKLTRDWYQGSWSDNDGYPTALSFFDGRLWVAGRTKLWGSVSDGYTSFTRDDEEEPGDSKSIQKTIGFGPVDNINWLAASSRLMMGLPQCEVSVRSNSFGEVLTPTNTNLRATSSKGSSTIAPVVSNDRIFFAHRSGKKLYVLDYNAGGDKHEPTDITLLNKDLCSAGIKKLAVTEEPEPRVWVLLNDGTLRVLLVELYEEVTAWSRVDLGDPVEDIVTVPGVGEDRVYFVVNRAGGRYFEKMALSTESLGGSASKHYDGFVAYTSPGTTLTGLGHHEGETVWVWADGKERESHTVSSGQITVSASWTDVVVGKRHTAYYISNKISKYSSKSVLNSRKRVVNTGFVLKDYQPGSLKVGSSQALLKSFPAMEGGSLVDQSVTISDYDEVPFEFDGESESDPRIHLQGTGPCTVLALTYDVWSDDKYKSNDITTER